MKDNLSVTYNSGLTYEKLKEIQEKLIENSNPILTTKHFFFQKYFPELEAIEEYVIIASHLIDGVEKLEVFDWFYIDKNITNTNMFAVKKEHLDIVLNPKKYKKELG